jgi:nitroreductase
MPDTTTAYDSAIVGVGVGANYGSVLTYYSLYRTLSNFGHKVLMIPKIGASATDPELRDTHAITFARNHYNLGKLYSLSTVGELNKLAHTFVVGSDQVWNYGISQHFGKAFYLDFADEDKRKLSYAASFGHAKDFAPPEERKAISHLLQRFNAISVREDSGVRIARENYQVPATQVAEPIFLTAEQDYLELASRSTHVAEGPYLLAYILDPTSEKRAAIQHISGKLGLPVRVILDGWPHLFETNKTKLGIDGAVVNGVDTYTFLKLYAGCSYVITDSFHGTAFALKFNKPFAAIGNRRRGIVRFDSLFRLVGHRDRFTHSPDLIIKEEERFLAPLDFKDINGALARHVTDSKEWLGAALKLPTERKVGFALPVNQPPRSTPHKAKTLARAAPLTFVVRNIRRLFLQQYQVIRRPVFESNSDAWQFRTKGSRTIIDVASPEDAVRGNLAWFALPAPLAKQRAYSMVLAWSPRTAARRVRVHLRNPTTGKFIVVGTIDISGRAGEPRTDKISFVVPKDGFSQVMFGAVHFTGPGAGADITSVCIRRRIPRGLPGPGTVPSESKKSPAEVVKEFSEIDDNRFLASYAQNRVSRHHGNARALMMFHSHGLEKGLSRSSNFRPGFGQATVPLLAAEMNKWIDQGGGTDDSFFKIAASVMNTYFERHRAFDMELSDLRALFNSKVWDAIEKAEAGKGGALPAAEAREEEVVGAVQRSFLEVAFGRRSVREFTTQPVSDADIQSAVRVAMQAPSVCNRQSWRVHVFEDQALMQAALDLQGGFRGYAMPPRLLLVTSDLTAFLMAVERNQPYIDGGLFLMMLMLGLQQMGLGSCPLNTAMSKERESSVRKILRIPDSEVFIAFVAVGHYDQGVLVPKSTRIPVEEVVRFASRLTASTPHSPADLPT